MRFPSADHDGISSPFSVSVTLLVPVPSAFITKMCGVPSRPLEKAIFSPSCDQAGWTWKNSPSGVDGSPFSFVSRKELLPSVSAPKIA